MEQLLLHLIGDYLTQTDWMATEKTKRSTAVVTHAIVYSLPFLLLGPSTLAFIAILSTHYLIDRYRLARYVVFAKNWITNPSLRWVDCSATGFWLLIIADNTMHLCINYGALRWL